MIAWQDASLASLHRLSAQFGVDEGVELAAVEDAFDVVGFDVGAVVFDAAVVEDVGADLGAEGDGLGVADDAPQLLVALGLLQGFELTLNDSDRDAAVLLL